MKNNVIHLRNYNPCFHAFYWQEILEKGVCDEVEEIKNSDFFQAQEVGYSH